MDERKERKEGRMGEEEKRKGRKGKEGRRVIVINIPVCGLFPSFPFNSIESLAY